ncbi:hypothetical protein BDP27DRAFT_1367537 [Rhodocollybia butyracea]|uniref:Uncharacterized protein n=1 Tax=Rhodocollybia butyracea TaxID=206335 RepID=A0A9P5PLB0_9AGAR|nr:hypothetical protein BDP27DRAFT_1367537 [Rhodocollybia butyracea]
MTRCEGISSRRQGKRRNSDRGYRLGRLKSSPQAAPRSGPSGERRVQGGALVVAANAAKHSIKNHNVPEKRPAAGVKHHAVGPAASVGSRAEPWLSRPTPPTPPHDDHVAVPARSLGGADLLFLGLIGPPAPGPTGALPGSDLFSPV